MAWWYLVCFDPGNYLLIISIFKPFQKGGYYGNHKKKWHTVSHFPGLFNDFLTKDLWNSGFDNDSPTGTTIPIVNIKECNENFTVEMTAPGIHKNDFEVELNGNTLIITSENNQEEQTKKTER